MSRLSARSSNELITGLYEGMVRYEVNIPEYVLTKIMAIKHNNPDRIQR